MISSTRMALPPAPTVAVSKISRVSSRDRRHHFDTVRVVVGKLHLQLMVDTAANLRPPLLVQALEKLADCPLSRFGIGPRGGFSASAGTRHVLPAKAVTGHPPLSAIDPNAPSRKRPTWKQLEQTRYTFHRNSSLSAKKFPINYITYHFLPIVCARHTRSVPIKAKWPRFEICRHSNS